MIKIWGCYGSIYSLVLLGFSRKTAVLIRGDFVFFHIGLCILCIIVQTDGHHFVGKLSSVHGWANKANSAYHPLGVDKLERNIQMYATMIKWWRCLATLMRWRQIWCIHRYNC